MEILVFFPQTEEEIRLLKQILTNSEKFISVIEEVIMIISLGLC